MVSFSILRLDPTSPWALYDFWPGWLNYFVEISNFNFGLNLQGEPIRDELFLVFSATMELCIISFALALLIGIPVGTLAGLRQGKWLDTLISFTSMSAFSAPIYWVALLSIMLFSLSWEWLPVSGRYNLLYEIPRVTGFATIDVLLSNDEHKFAAFYSIVEHMILPCIVLALAPATQFVRLMRASVAEVMTQNYIRAARIKGLTSFQIVREHVLRNAIPPIIPMIGVQLSSMLAFAIVAESIFNWPGIGRWLLDALAHKDYVSIQAGVLMVATFVLAAQILSDLVGTLVNPLARKEWYVNK
jgi:cationic peptide transport system permease protein